MGLFHRNENNANFAGGSRNVMESLQGANNTGALIYLDGRQDFNTNTVITVRPFEQVIYIKNGEIYAVLPPGTHEVKSENYPLLSRIRSMLTGGVSTFTCQTYRVQTKEHKLRWGTATPIAIQDYHLGGGREGIPTKIRGTADLSVRFNISEDFEAATQTFLRLMGDETIFTPLHLEERFNSQIAAQINEIIGDNLEETSKHESINAISRKTKDLAEQIQPRLEILFAEYGLDLVYFSFNNLNIEESDERTRLINLLAAAAHTTHTEGYDKALQQELLKDIANNPGSGGVAGLGAGIGMGVATGSAFAQIANSAFDTTQQKQSSAAPSDPVEALSKMKQLLDAGLIKQEQYDAKVAEIISRI